MTSSKRKKAPWIRITTRIKNTNLPRLRVIREGDPNCVHHWIIDRTPGLVSLGKCNRCSAIREFYNVNPKDYGKEAENEESV